MQLSSWMYVSRSLLTPMHADTELERIVSAAKTYNHDHGITGALLFTGTRFAQYIEGAPDELMPTRQIIHMDRRHTDIVVVEEKLRDKRCFEGWSLAFVGTPSHYVARVIERAVLPRPEERQSGVEALQRLMTEFVNQAVLL